MYQISSQLPEFYRRYYKKNILVSFFLDRVYIQNSAQNCMQGGMLVPQA